MCTGAIISDTDDFKRNMRLNSKTNFGFAFVRSFVRQLLRFTPVKATGIDRRYWHVTMYNFDIL